jgi:P-type Cu2+ transporter
VFTVPLLVLGMAFIGRFSWENWLMLVLALPVWAYVGRGFHLGAIRALRHGAVNMDTLISLFGKVSPIFAAGAMALSSVTVVSNSLRLRGTRSATLIASSIFTFALLVVGWAVSITIS